MNPEKNFQESEVKNVEQKPNVLNSITPLSKYLAMILFIFLPFLGGWVGYTYSPEKITETPSHDGRGTLLSSPEIISGHILTASPLSSVALVLQNGQISMSVFGNDQKHDFSLPLVTEHVMREIMPRVSNLVTYSETSLDIDVYSGGVPEREITLQIKENLTSEGGGSTLETVFGINLDTGTEKKLYSFEFEAGHGHLGSTTFTFGNNDLIFDCRDNGYYLPDPRSRIFSFSRCEAVSVVRDYEKRILEEWVYVYYDVFGEKIEPERLNDLYSFADLYTYHSELSEGKVSLVMGDANDIVRGGPNRKLFELDFSE